MTLSILTTVVAQSSRVNPVPVIIWSIALLAILIVGMAWAARLKRKIKAGDASPTAPMGFTLSDLRQMHRAGQLTDAEFAKARDKIIDAAKRVAERPPAPDGTFEKDSADAIRARRLAREAQEQQQQKPDDPSNDPESP